MGTTITYRLDENPNDGSVVVLAGPVINDPDSGPYADLDVVATFTPTGHGGVAYTWEGPLDGDAIYAAWHHRCGTPREAAAAYVEECKAEDRERAMEAAVDRYEQAIDDARYDNDRRFA